MTTAQQQVPANAAQPQPQLPANAAADVTSEGPSEAVLGGPAAASPEAVPFPQAAPVDGIGQPVDEALGIQPQVTELGLEALWIHDWVLMPVMVGISLFVLGLMLWVAVRYRAKANPTPSKTTHNTFVEVVWTLVPVLILVAIAIPSISLLARQYTPAPANAVTIKAIGNQWYWGYEYPDHGIDITANMLPDDVAKQRGEPRLLAVDNRVVVPVGVPIKMLVTANDVIHSWAVPAFWVKMDAVPGRINEVTFQVDKPGVYYGQCSELCGARHAYMPIAVEAVAPAQFAAWVASKGGNMPGAPTAEGDSAGEGNVTRDAAAPADSPASQPANVVEANVQAPVSNQSTTDNEGGRP